MSAKDEMVLAWREGVFLEPMRMSNDLSIGSERGVIMPRSVKLMAGSQRRGLEMIESIQWTPWKPDLDRSGHTIPTYICDGAIEQDDVEESVVVADDEDVRQIYIYIYIYMISMHQELEHLEQ